MEVIARFLDRMLPGRNHSHRKRATRWLWRAGSLMTGLLLAALVQSIAGEGGQPAPIAESPWGLTLAAYVRDGGPQRGFARWARETQPELRSSDAVQRAATELDKHMAAATGGASIPMAAMAITREGATLYRSEHGLNVDSLFPVASVAKTFTAVAVLELADQGRLQLDDEIGRYLPELSFAQRPEGGRAVTIRHLLQHSSGLPYFARGGGTNLRCPHSGMALYIPSQYKPAGESHFYSNFNYNVLACLIERVSGERFDEYVTNQVLRPAGMDHSRLSPASNGAAGLNSTVADMGRFLSVVFDERSPRPLLSAQMRAEMIAPPAFLKGRVGRDEMYYALGVRVQYRHGHPAEVYHTGVWYNTFAEMRYFLTQGGAMATIANPPDFRSPLLYGFRDTNPLLGGRYLDAANQFVDSSSNMVGAAGY